MRRTQLTAAEGENMGRLRSNTGVLYKQSPAPAVSQQGKKDLGTTIASGYTLQINK